MVTRYPRACSNLAREAEIMPFPSEEVTPPVTNMYLVGFKISYCLSDINPFYAFLLFKIINDVDFPIQQFNIFFGAFDLRFHFFDHGFSIS